MSTFPFILDEEEEATFPFEDSPTLPFEDPPLEDSLATVLKKKIVQTVPLMQSSLGGSVPQAVGEAMQDLTIRGAARGIGESTAVKAAGALAKGAHGLIVGEAERISGEKVQGPDVDKVVQAISERVPSEVTRVLDEKPPEFIREAGRHIAEFGIDVRKRRTAEAIALEPNVEPGTVKAFLGDVAGTTTRMIPAILAGAITRSPNISLAVLFPDVLGESYGRARDKKLEPDVALLDSLATAGSEILTERIPLGVLLRSGGGMLKKILKTAGLEGVQEYVQGGVEQLIDKGILRDEMSFEEVLDTLLDPKVQKDMLYQAAIGAATGGLLGGGVGLAEKVLNPAATPPDTLPLKETEAFASSNLWDELNLPRPLSEVQAKATIAEPLLDLDSKIAATTAFEFENAYNDVVARSAAIVDDNIIVAGFNQSRDTAAVSASQDSAINVFAPTGGLSLQEFASENIAQSIFDSVSSWQKRFAPHLKITVADEVPTVISAALTPQGAAPLKLLNEATGFMWQESSGRYHITMNSQSFIERGDVNYPKMYNTLSHEFGHVIAFDILSRSPKDIQMAVKKAYLDWHKDAYTGTLGKMLEAKFSLTQASRWKAYFGQALGTNSLDTPVYEILRNHGEEANRFGYLLSFNEWMADQYARYATNPAQGLGLADKFFVRAAALLKHLYKSTDIQAKFAAHKDYVNWLMWTRESRFEEALINTHTGAKIAGELSAISDLDVPGLSRLQMWQVGGQIDRFNKVMDQLYTVRQIAQLNPHIEGLQKFVIALEAMAVTKNHVLHQAEERLIELSNLGKGRLDNVGRFLLEETVAGQFFNMQDPNIIRQYALDPQMVEVIQKVKADFGNILTQLETVLAADIIERYRNNPAAMQLETQKLHTTMQRMRQVPYFPLARFGNYSVIVRAKSDIIIDGKLYKAGTVVDMRTFPSKSEQEAGSLGAKDDYAGHDVGVGMDFIEDVSFEFQGIPPQVFEALESELTLTSRQREALKQYRLENAPGRSYMKHMKRRNKVYGFSEDVERAYASYMMSAANHVARITHYKALNAAKTEIAESATEIQKQEGNATRRRLIHQYTSETYDYVMNPVNEWANYRALAFMFYLGFNVKSAFVQMTQLPLTTYPRLATEFGDAKAVQAMTVATKWAYEVWKNPAAIPPLTRQALQQAEDAGVVNQSFATIVAGVSEGHALQRVIPGSKGARMIRQGGYLASFMFAKMELLNRRITFMAAFKLASEKGMAYEAAYDYAKNAVQDTQFEYARWNRPKLFRGKKGVFFIFKMYTQGMLFFFLHDKARVRFIMMLGALGGLMGLPFASHILDLIDFAMSGDDEKFDSRKEIREFLAELTSKPDLIMHGISRESFGLAALADFIGVPFPRIDLSGSVGLGQVIPGFEAMVRPGTSEERMQRAATDAAGAGIAVPIQLAQMILTWDSNPDKARHIERSLPSAIKAGAQAFRRGREGGETDPRGAMKVPMSWQDTEQRMEIIANGLGFQPTRITERRAQDEMFKKHAEFFSLRQSKLLQDFSYVYILKDREGVADVRKAIRRYNQEVPHGSLRITGEMLRTSVKSRMRNIKKVEKGIPLEGKKYRGLYREIDRLFPDEEIEAEVLRNQELAPDIPFAE